MEWLFKRVEYSYWRHYQDGPGCHYWEPETITEWYVFGVCVWSRKVLDNGWGDRNPQEEWCRDDR